VTRKDVQLLARELDIKVPGNRASKELYKVEELHHLILSLAYRVLAQSECLSRVAEKRNEPTVDAIPPTPGSEADGVH